MQHNPYKKCKIVWNSAFKCWQWQIYKRIYCNNTFYNSGKGDIGGWNSNSNNSNLVIKNNIFYSTKSTYATSISISQGLPPYVISHNLFYPFKAGNNFNESKLVSSIVNQNPLLNNDLSLQYTSPAHSKGVTFNFFNTDYYGNARSGSAWDLGAFESAGGGGGGVTSNLITNPNFDTDLTGWGFYFNNQGSAVASRIWSNLNNSNACKVLYQM